MNDNYKNEVARIIEDDVIKYLELEVRSANKPEVENILNDYKKKKIKTQEILYRLNEINESDLSKKLFNMIHMHQKNYYHIISIVGKTL